MFDVKHENDGSVTINFPTKTTASLALTYLQSFYLKQQINNHKLWEDYFKIEESELRKAWWEVNKD